MTETAEVEALDRGSVADTARALELAETLLTEPFHVNDCALVRFKLAKMSRSRYVFILAIHHLISDYISRRVLLREFWILYQALNAGDLSSFRRPSHQFLSYLTWQRRTHELWEKEDQPHWTRKLDGAVGLTWPTVIRASSPGSRTVKTSSISLSIDLTDSLRKLAMRAQVLLSTEILAVYIALASRICRQTDLVVAINTTGRDRMEFHQVIGLLAHPLYLRLRLRGDESYDELLGLVDQEHYAALLKKDFGGLVTESPDLMARTLFQWFPSIEGFGNRISLDGEAGSTGVEVERLPLLLPSISDVILTNELDLMLTFSERPDSIVGTALYRSDVFSPEGIARMLSGFLNLAENVVVNPSMSFADHDPFRGVH